MNYFRTKNLEKKTLKQKNTISSQITVSVIFPVCWHSWTADPRTRVGWRLTCPSLGIIRVLITSLLNAFGCEEWLMIPSSRMCFINTLRWDWRVVFWGEVVVGMLYFDFVFLLMMSMLLLLLCFSFCLCCGVGVVFVDILLYLVLTWLFLSLFDCDIVLYEDMYWFIYIVSLTLSCSKLYISSWYLSL